MSVRICPCGTALSETQVKFCSQTCQRKDYTAKKSAFFPETPQLSDDAKTRRLTMLKTLYHKPLCWQCRRKATYFNPVDGEHYCTPHLPADARRRLTMEWQWREIIMPIDRHVTQLTNKR